MDLHLISYIIRSIGRDVRSGKADAVTIWMAADLLTDNRWVMPDGAVTDLLEMVAGASPETVNEIAHTSMGRAALVAILGESHDHLPANVAVSPV